MQTGTLFSCWGFNQDICVWKVDRCGSTNVRGGAGGGGRGTNTFAEMACDAVDTFVAFIVVSSSLVRSFVLASRRGHTPPQGGGKHKDFGTQHRRESNQYPFVGGKIWQFSSIMVQLKRIRTLHFLCLVPFMYKTSLKHVKSNVKPLLLNFYVYY